MQPPIIIEQQIEAGLRQLGIQEGNALEVHSSLRSFGSVEGGAASVIHALMRVVGPQGTIIMSAYPVSPPIPLSEEEQARGMTWKVRIFDEDSDEPSGMGVISDTFRKMPGVICGKGLHRVCAWGREAEQHSRDYRHLVDVDGSVLLMGVGIDRCSSMHLAEETVRLPEAITSVFTLPPDIRRDYDPSRWSVGYGSTPDDAWMKVYQEADRRGLIKHQQIGNADCLLFKAQSVILIYEHWLRTDPFGLFGMSKP